MRTGITFRKWRKLGGIEIDQLIKMILAAIVFLILLYIIVNMIGGELTAQGNDLKSSLFGFS